MKRLLLAGVAMIGLAGTALAADMGVRAAPPPPPPPLPVWTGFYAGLNGGFAVAGQDDIDVTEFNTATGALFVSGNWPGAATFSTLHLQGAFGGGQIGYNWQAGIWVFGIEADLEGAAIRDTGGMIRAYQVFPVAANLVSTITATAVDKVDWYGTVRARLGWTWGNNLVYATGGLAYGHSDYTLQVVEAFGAVGAPVPLIFALANNTTTRTGYAVGAGWEFGLLGLGLSPRWTGKLEYQYINLGHFDVVAQEFVGAPPAALVPITFAVSTNANVDFHTFRVGVNYRFLP